MRQDSFLFAAARAALLLADGKQVIVTDTKGHKPGYLFYPDGFDIDVFRDGKAALGKP